jgi:hypothetical protein
LIIFAEILSSYFTPILIATHDNKDKPTTPHILLNCKLSTLLRNAGVQLSSHAVKSALKCGHLGHKSMVGGFQLQLAKTIDQLFFQFKIIIYKDLNLTSCSD